MIDRKTLLGIAAGMFIGWFVFDGGSPFTPMKPDRPVLRLLSRAARSALWFMLVAEPPRSEPRVAQSLHTATDGSPILDHARGL